MVIRITKCSQSSSWYNNRIGQMFNVLETDNKEKHYIVHKGRLLISYVDFSDCEIVSS